MQDVVVAFDVGATWIRGAIFSGGRILFKLRSPTPRISDGEAVSNALVDIAKTLLERAGARPRSVGVAIFGPIDYSDGSVVNPPNHPAERIPVRGPLEDMLGVPVTLVNDAVAGAWSGSQITGSKDLVYIALGTGVGVGVVVSGRLLLGRRGDSHEAGHIVLDYRSGSICGCGGRGHWEALYSGRALQGREGDPRVVAAGIASLVACYDPEIILLGGGLVEAGLIGPSIGRLVREYSFQGRVPRILLHPLREDANLYGAYLLAVRPTPEILRLNGW
ncbi:MAG: ROK family protein [Desulfurococcales archaeon]|nr:ROK family protein [Desulfurococcales archaeon]